jgi:hypothetical protein
MSEMVSGITGFTKKLKMTKPIQNEYKLSDTPPHGRFGAIRKHDIHTGYDIYCKEFEPVHAIEDGVVTDICYFTGTKATPPMPWWEDTMAIGVEGKSGVILYGEVVPFITLGENVKEGEIIGFVKRVLSKDKGLPMTMLHVELYEHGYRGNWTIWEEDGERPLGLLNSETILFDLYD